MHIGITGGIGSGKTTICKIFESLGIPVYYADDRAKQLMVQDMQLMNDIRAVFGTESYHTNGRLNRAYLANIVFNDPIQLKKLNSLVHPAVFRDGTQWQQQQGHAPYTLKEAALLFESGSAQQLDRMICVYAPVQLRVERVMRRDRATEEEVRARMSRQLPELDKMMLSDYIITNDGKSSLICQVLHIHRSLHK